MNNSSTGRKMVQSALLATLGLVMVSHADIDQVRDGSKPVFEIPLVVVEAQKSKAEKQPILEIIDEALMPGATVFRYPYPQTPPPGMVDNEHFSGKSAMQLILTPKAWSGMSACWGGGLDLSKKLRKSAIELWVKGSKCKEKQCWGPVEIGLMDDGRYSNGRQLRAYVNASNYGTVTDSTWTHMVIPVKDLSFQGSYWDDGINGKVQSIFNWESVACFTIDAADNSIPSFGLFFDKVRIIPLDAKK